jgi:glycosyltransferase involved in cell wall biosynthesis
MARKKIMVLGSFAESLTRFRGVLMAELVGQGYDVLACAPAADDATRQRLAALGVRYVDIAMQRTGLNPLADLGLLWRLAALLRRERPDVLFCYTIKPVVYGALAARLVGRIRVTPMITGLGYAFMGGGGRRQRWVSAAARALYRLALQRAHCVFFQNPDDLGEFRRLGLLPAQARIQQVPGSGVDTLEYAQMPVPVAPVFLLVARLVRDKGVYEYVEAARQVRLRYPAARFQIAGWIDENPTAIPEEALAAWLSEGVIEFLGKLEDVRPALAACAVYVLPSYREGTPRSVLEAMAVGRAIITTDAPGCRETVVDQYNGVLVPVADAARLAQAMCSFIERPERVEEYARASRLLAEQRFDVRIVNRLIIQGMDLPC